jgi:benzoate-CoA ligase
MQTIPDQFNFVVELFKTSNPAAIAIEDAEQVWTYAELEQRVGQLAAWLQALGIQPEQRVAIVMKDSAETVALMLAVIYGGMVAVPLDPRANKDSLCYCIQHSGAVMVVKENDLELGLDYSMNKSLISYEHAPVAGYKSHRDAACIFMYTSGTTGHPKAVVHRQATPYIIGTVTGPHLGYTSKDRTFNAAKLFYSFGMFNLWATLFAGATVILHPGIFVPTTIANLVVSKQVTFLIMIPVLYGKLSEQNLQGHCLRKCISGADKLSATIYDRWKTITGIDIHNLYGSTEIAGALAYNSGDAPVHSIGRVIPGYEIDIRDGHLYIQAPTAGLYYWHDKHWSAKQFGEWMPTGDIVEQDQAGNLYFLGRASDVIKVNGNYVDLSAIEQALLNIPGVQETVVVGQVQDNGHARLKAYIVPTPDQTVSHELVHQHVKEMAIIDQLPRTQTGKIQRYKLRAKM